MTRALRRKLLLGVALVAVLAGVAAAVVMAAQPRTTGHARHAHHAHHPRLGTLATAAAYLGLSRAQLRSELQAGKSLAQIADATPGKSEAGLVQALERTDRQRLAAAFAKLPRVVAAQVAAVGGPHGGFAGNGGQGPKRAGRQVGALAAAAGYLGVSAQQLRRDLRSGKTLAQLAAATSGKSEAGLLEALVTAGKAQLAARVARGALTQTRANEILPQLTARASAEAKRARHHAAPSAPDAGA